MSGRAESPPSSASKQVLEGSKVPGFDFCFTLSDPPTLMGRVNDIFDNCRRWSEMFGHVEDDLAFWKGLVEEFFDLDGCIIVVLVNGNGGESTTYKLVYELLPGYLRKVFRKDMHDRNFQFDGIEERKLENGNFYLTSKRMTMTYQDDFGQKYSLEGLLFIEYAKSYKMLKSESHFQFLREVSNDTPASTRRNINELGMTTEWMRYLEMADTFQNLSNIISISQSMNLSPKEGLSRWVRAFQGVDEQKQDSTVEKGELNSADQVTSSSPKGSDEEKTALGDSAKLADEKETDAQEEESLRKRSRS